MGGNKSYKYDLVWSWQYLTPEQLILMINMINLTKLGGGEDENRHFDIGDNL